jgi:hypothetical protein
MAQRPRTPSNYRSGTDFTMEFGTFRFRFNTRDFRERVEHAAVQLAFVVPGSLGDEDIDQLVELVAHGEIATDGDLRSHIDDNRDVILGFDEDLTHWMRKLVFRGAWVDQQIKEGLVEPLLEDSGFVYRCTTTSELIEELVDVPSWSRVGYRTERQ